MSTSVATSTVSNKSFGIIQSNDSSSSRTGLIVGLVLGLVGGLALIGGAITAIVYQKKKAASAAAANKPVDRAVMANQSAPNTHLQSKNLRTVRLAPLVTQPSKLHPPLTTTNPSSFHRSNAPTNLKGIPLRLDPITYEILFSLDNHINISYRSPTSIFPQYTLDPSVSNYGFSFRPITNLSTVQHPLTHQLQEPKARPHQTLNIGGDTRH